MDFGPSVGALVNKSVYVYKVRIRKKIYHFHLHQNFKINPTNMLDFTSFQQIWRQEQECSHHRVFTLSNSHRSMIQENGTLTTQLFKMNTARGFNPWINPRGEKL